MDQFETENQKSQPILEGIQLRVENPIFPQQQNQAIIQIVGNIIFSKQSSKKDIQQAFLTFEVENLEQVINLVGKYGGKQIGQIQKQKVNELKFVTYVIAEDIEQNRFKIQHTNLLKNYYIEIEQLNNQIQRQNQLLQKEFSILHSLGFISQGGSINQLNQDKFIILPIFNSNAKSSFIGIYDGYGPMGEQVSSFVRDNLHKQLSLFLKNDKDQIDIRQQIVKAYKQTNKLLFDHPKIDTQISGSCGLSIYIRNNNVYCANVGDSKAALFSMKVDDTWTYKLLSVDHKPGYQGEMQRIIKAGGRVESQEQKKYDTNQNQQNTTNSKQQQTNSKNNDMKMWLKNIQAPGLAISRSFGDYLGSKIGLIADPDIFQFNLNNYDKFIVMGSNGLWEFLNLDQILNIVNEYYEQRYINQLAAQQAADYLIDLAQQKWVQNDSLIDDITVIVVFLKGSQQNPINNLGINNYSRLNNNLNHWQGYQIQYQHQNK